LTKPFVKVELVVAALAVVDTDELEDAEPVWLVPASPSMPEATMLVVTSEPLPKNTLLLLPRPETTALAPPFASLTKVPATTPIAAEADAEELAPVSNPPAAASADALLPMD